MPEATIQPLKNGPLLVKGPVQWVDAQGQPMPFTELTLASLSDGPRDKD